MTPKEQQSVGPYRVLEQDRSGTYYVQKLPFKTRTRKSFESGKGGVTLRHSQPGRPAAEALVQVTWYGRVRAVVDAHMIMCLSEVVSHVYDRTTWANHRSAHNNPPRRWTKRTFSFVLRTRSHVTQKERFSAQSLFHHSY